MRVQSVISISFIASAPTTLAKCIPVHLSSSVPAGISSASAYSTASSSQDVSVSTASDTAPATTPKSASATTSYSNSLPSHFSNSSYSESTSNSPSATWSTASSTISSTASSSSATSSASAAPSACAYWLEDLKAQGIAAFNANPADYKVFRNVMDYGAKGDGVTDDTEAINRAISDGNSVLPRLPVPPWSTSPDGTYIVSDSIVNYYYTQIVGNPNCMPVIKGSSGFKARWVIDGNQYGSNGQLGWGATDVFWTQVRNVIIDTTEVRPSLQVAGIHWTVSQATLLQNIIFKLSQASGTQHQGVFIAEGSGGFMSDLSFTGGAQGMAIGNQQFTMRNLTFNNVATAIDQLWDWGWTYYGLKINNCTVGLNLTAVTDKGEPNVASVVLFDSEFSNTDKAVITARTTQSKSAGGALILENVSLANVRVVVEGPSGTTLLEGTSGTRNIAAWGQGSQYTSKGQRDVFQGEISPHSRPGSLTTGTGFYQRSMPKYENLPISDFVVARAEGATGDGHTDDTEALQAAILKAAKSGKVLLVNAGYYKVTKTLYVPPGSKIIGEALPVIMSSGAFFNNMKDPKPVVQVGAAGGEVGQVEWSEMFVSTQGAQAGAILIEWNILSKPSDASGMWNVHVRVGGFAGSQLQVEQCIKTPEVLVTSAVKEECVGAFMSVHVTPVASGLYMENCWIWIADHDVDDANKTQITVYAGRGMLIESVLGGVWVVGSGVEHHALYEYNLVSTRDVFMGQIQTETAYYQPNPDALVPFPRVSKYNDPEFKQGEDGWGLRIVNSKDILVYGAGMYSFFNNNNVHCSDQGNSTKCQSRIFSIESSGVSVYNLNTVGTTHMITQDGSDLASWEDNQAGFISNVALFRS
ncbi:glycoside hydrolase family 55 protein [Apiospora marii]|uniref:Glycoside hydrolase family 55 protein n=1 Tax=Apiospora marii TaxID=335849 RepID=A0ABR1R781_9PEZI